MIQSLPDSGPAVVVNVHHTRCDAIALIAGVDEPLHIQLPRLSWKKVKTFQQDFITHLAEHSLCNRAAELDSLEAQQTRGVKPHIHIHKVHYVLEGLWKDVVKPVLEALAFSVSGLYLTSPFILTTLIDFETIIQCRATQDLVVPNWPSGFSSSPCSWNLQG